MSSSEPARVTFTAEEEAVLRVLQEVFDARAVGDKRAMQQRMLPLGWGNHSRDGRVSSELLWDYPDRVEEAKSLVEERIHAPLVRVDDNIAMVWCSYEVFHDGEPHHWGTNAVSFMKIAGRWRISGITSNGRSGPSPA